jgi:toxin ParE1/3/4
LLPPGKDDVPQIHHTVRARRDLLDIWFSIATDNPAAADRVYDRLEARVRILERFPEVGPARPDIAADARVLVEPPYLILYRITPAGPQIVRVLHGARRIDAALFGEGMQ